MSTDQSSPNPSPRARTVPASEIAWPKGHRTGGAPFSPTLERRPAAFDGADFEPATVGVRTLYLLALAQLMFPIGLMVIATFPSLAKAGTTGIGFATVVSVGFPSVLSSIAIVWRAMDVLRGRCRLAAPPAFGVLHWLRKISLLLMLIGVGATLLTWFSGPIVRALVPTRTDSGVEFFVARMWLGGFALWATSGLLLFEFGRLLSFERAARAA